MPQGLSDRSNIFWNSKGNLLLSFQQAAYLLCLFENISWLLVHPLVSCPRQQTFVLTPSCSFFSSAFTKSTVILAVDSVKLIRIYHTLRQQRKMVTHRVGWIICYQSSIIQYMLLQGLWKHSNETRKVLHRRKEEAARIEFPARILIWQSLEAQR